MKKPTEHPGKLGFTVEAREALDLIADLLERPDPGADGERNIRDLYPDAAEECIRASAFHLYRELPRALVELLVDIELSLREPKRRIDQGKLWHVLYHVQNSSQLESLMPWYREDFATELDAAIEAMESDDREFVVVTLRKLKKIGCGRNSPTGIDEAEGEGE